MPNYHASFLRLFMPKSIHRFLIASLLGILTVAVAFIAILTYYQLSAQNTRVIKAQLVQSADIIDAIINLQRTTNPGRINQLYHRLTTLGWNTNNHTIHFDLRDHSKDRWSNFQNRLMFQIWDENSGHLLIKSSNAPDKVMVLSEHGFGQYKTKQATWDTFTLSNRKMRTRTVVAISSANKINLDLFIHDITILFITYLIIGVIIVWIIQFSFSPLRNITNELTQKDADNLDKLKIKDIPIEVMPLIKELNRLFQRLEAAIYREKRFAADAAHELRTPLAALKTQVEVARREKDHTQRARILKNIILSTNRCAHVVEQMLTLSRIEPEVINQQKEEIDIVDVARSLLAEICPQAIAKNIEISLNAPNIVKMLGSAVSIGILLRNLVDNAIRHTPNNGDITVSIEQQPNHILLSVTDSGPGIPEELQQRVFDRFYSLPGPHSRGSGLGLSIVQQIARQHQAKVSAQTPKNHQGLCVCVSFKLN